MRHCPICEELVGKIKPHIRKIHPEKSIEQWYRSIYRNASHCSICKSSTNFNLKYLKFRKTCSSKCKKIAVGKACSLVMKNAWTSNEHYKKVFTEERKKKHSESAKKNWRNIEYRSNFFDGICRNMNSEFPTYGKNINKGKRHNYEGHLFRSTWERDFAKTMNKSGIVWEYEPRSFSYISSTGNNSNYLVDFFLPEFDLYVEIKAPYWVDENTKLKLEAVESTGNKILLFTENNYDVLLEGV